MKRLILLSALLCSACYPKERILQVDYYDSEGELQHIFLYVEEQAKNEFITTSQGYYKVESPFYIVDIFDYNKVKGK